MDKVTSEELDAEWLAAGMDRKRAEALFSQIVAHSTVTK
jgi:hypothetical protein